MANKITNHSPILLKYQQAFELNRRSRVFAPLAEGYRKLGLIDKALEICREGLRHNPGYVLGHFTLSQCYYDIGQKELAFDTIRPFVVGNRDNLFLQRFYANLSFSLGEKEEALNTFKYLLFSNPKDKEVAQMVLELEENRGAGQVIIAQNSINENNNMFLVDKLNSVQDQGLDDWVTLELNHRKVLEDKKVIPDSSDHHPKVDEIIAWEELNPNLMINKNLSLSNKDELKEETVEFPIPKLKDSEEITFEVENKLIDNNQKIEDSPIITHTLVDLYLAQGLHNKAHDVLEKILELHPLDQKTRQKFLEIEDLIAQVSHDDAVPPAENDLMGLVEKVQFEKINQKKLLLENFLSAIKSKAIAKQHEI